MTGFLPPQLQRIVLDWDGNQRTDFCNLDGTITDADCPEIPEGLKFGTNDDISSYLD